MNFAIFASGNGTNFENIVKTKFKSISCSLLVCNKKDALVIERAKKYGIEVYIFSYDNYKTREEAESIVLYKLKEANIKFIVLAGYMRILSKVIIDYYPNKIINIHPALLPSFKGKQAIKDAYEYGVKVFGVSVHYVDVEVDSGKIIEQNCFHVKNMSYEEIEKRIHKLEYKMYPRVIKNIFDKGRML